MRACGYFAQAPLEEAALTIVANQAEGEFIALGRFAVRTKSSQHVGACGVHKVIGIEFACR